MGFNSHRLFTGRDHWCDVSQVAILNLYGKWVAGFGIWDWRRWQEHQNIRKDQHHVNKSKKKKSETANHVEVTRSTINVAIIVLEFLEGSVYFGPSEIKITFLNFYKSSQVFTMRFTESHIYILCAALKSLVQTLPGLQYRALGRRARAEYTPDASFLIRAFYACPWWIKALANYGSVMQISSDNSRPVRMTVWVSSTWQAVSMETLLREHLVARQHFPDPLGEEQISAVFL